MIVDRVVEHKSRQLKEIASKSLERAKTSNEHGFSKMKDILVEGSTLPKVDPNPMFVVGTAPSFIQDTLA